MPIALCLNHYVDQPGPRVEPIREVRHDSEPVNENVLKPLAALTPLQSTFKNAWVDMPELVIVRRERDPKVICGERWLVKRPGTHHKPQWFTSKTLRFKGSIHAPEYDGDVFVGSVPVWLYERIYRAF